MDPKCWVEKGIEAMADGLGAAAWSLVEGSFTGEGGRLSADQYNVATGFSGKWLPVMLILTLFVTVISIARGAFSLKPDAIFSAVLKGVLAWPLTLIAIWMAIKVTHGVDGLVAVMLPEGGQSFQAMFTTIGSGGGTAGVVAEVGDAPAALGALGGGALAMLITFIIIFILSLILSIILVFRNLSILALIAFAPVVLMLLPGGQTMKQWSWKWLEMFIATALIKPVAAGFLLLTSAIAAQPVTSWQPAVMAIAGLILACASPMIANKFVSFAGIGGADTGAESIPGRVAAGQARGAGRATGGWLRKSMRRRP